MNVLETLLLPDVNKVYQKLEELVKFGKREEAAFDEVYQYEQQSGTCTILSGIALIRHQILTQPGTHEQNYIQYKLFKGLYRQTLWQSIDFQIDQTSSGNVDQTIYRLAKDKMQHAALSSVFLQFAKDENFKDIANSYFKALEIPLEAHPEIPVSLEERILLIKELNHQLALSLIKQFEKNEPFPIHSNYSIFQCAYIEYKKMMDMISQIDRTYLALIQKGISRDEFKENLSVFRRELVWLLKKGPSDHYLLSYVKKLKQERLSFFDYKRFIEWLTAQCESNDKFELAAKING